MAEGKNVVVWESQEFRIVKTPGGQFFYERVIGTDAMGCKNWADTTNNTDLLAAICNSEFNDN